MPHRHILSARHLLGAIAGLSLGSLSLQPAQAADDIIRLATTTSTYNSGLLDNLLPAYEQANDVTVQVIAVGTGKALRMGQDGDVDLVMTHAPGAERKFVDAGYGIEPHGVMYNDFVLLGPKADPANVEGMSDVDAALARIAESNAGFVSRGDDSGTHKKELSLWASADVVPDFSAYKAVGQGMGKVLSMASELQDYTLSDRGTWLAMQDKLDLSVLVEGDARLFNPYQVILVNPANHEGLNTEGARALAQWLISREGQQAIDDFRLKGQALFHASHGETGFDAQKTADGSGAGQAAGGETATQQAAPRS